MIISFFIQLLLAVLFFIGLVGIGFLLLKMFSLKKDNIFFDVGLAFFASLCLYTIISVSCLFVFKNKLSTLRIISLIYFLASYIILIYHSKIRFSDFKKYLSDFRWFFIMLFFVSFIFFFGLYHTALLDEWLHRPIIKFFVTNGIFPLKNPYDPNQNYILTYHYGTQIIGSAIQLITKIGIPESLDVMKISFLLATFSLIFGLIYSWSRRINFSLLGTVLVLFCGSSFFLQDPYALAHFWAKSAMVFNYPLLYAINGITWVNLPLSLAFILILQEIFYNKVDYRFRVIILFVVLIVGFFLISELFGMLIVGAFIFSAIYNVFRKKVVLDRFLLVFLAFTIIVFGIYFFGGTVTNSFLTNSDISKLVEIRGISNWGYPAMDGSIMLPWEYLFDYFRNFLLESICLVLIIYFTIKNKIPSKDFILFYLVLFVTFIVPFVVATSMGNLNLYKLTHLGILFSHLLIFYYFAKVDNKKLFYPIAALFIIGSIPVVLVNLNIWTGKLSPKIVNSFRCGQNDYCYSGDSNDILNLFEKQNHAIKYIVADRQDAQEIIDLSNSMVFNSDKLNENNLKQSGARYIFLSPNLKNNLSIQGLDISGYSVLLSKGDFSILKIN
jgi:hypothetical protein